MLTTRGLLFPAPGNVPTSLSPYPLNWFEFARLGLLVVQFVTGPALFNAITKIISNRSSIHNNCSSFPDHVFHISPQDPVLLRLTISELTPSIHPRLTHPVPLFTKHTNTKSFSSSHSWHASAPLAQSVTCSHCCYLRPRQKVTKHAKETLPTAKKNHKSLFYIDFYFLARL